MTSPNLYCLTTYRSTRTLAPPTLSPEPQASPGKPYAGVRERLGARYGDHLPAHFKRCMARPQAKPYMHGDVHNVVYRRRMKLWNRPMPVPCEVTPESCLKREGAYILGDRCLEGIDEPLPWMDRKYEVTLNLLRALPAGAEVWITTRSDLVACEEYVAELKRLDARVRILCPAWKGDDWIRQNEPGAPSKTRRLAACVKLRELGVRAAMDFHELPTARGRRGAQ